MSDRCPSWKDPIGRDEADPASRAAGVVAAGPHVLDVVEGDHASTSRSAGFVPSGQPAGQVGEGGVGAAFVVGDRVEVTADRLDVAPGDRPGERGGRPEREHVVELARTSGSKATNGTSAAAASRSTWPSSATRWFEATTAAAWYAPRRGSSIGKGRSPSWCARRVTAGRSGDRGRRAGEPGRVVDAGEGLERVQRAGLDVGCGGAAARGRRGRGHPRGARRARRAGGWRRARRRRSRSRRRGSRRGRARAAAAASAVAVAAACERRRGSVADARVGVRPATARQGSPDRDERSRDARPARPGPDEGEPAWCAVGPSDLSIQPPGTGCRSLRAPPRLGRCAGPRATRRRAGGRRGRDRDRRGGPARSSAPSAGGGAPRGRGRGPSRRRPGGRRRRGCGAPTARPGPGPPRLRGAGRARGAGGPIRPVSRATTALR